MVTPPPPCSAAISGRLTRIHLCTGLLERDGAILLVASRYPNHDAPLWNLPGGRQNPNELLPAALKREFLEETGLEVQPGELAYVSESYDGATQFTNATFLVSGSGMPRVPENDAHVIAFEWVAKNEVGARISVRVVRDPLLAYLGGGRSRYYGYAEAGITIEFGD
ncbi:MAG: NUDIX domain-containing protein [Candidatus Baltobacteraceae bacterium]